MIKNIKFIPHFNVDGVVFIKLLLFEMNHKFKVKICGASLKRDVAIMSDMVCSFARVEYICDFGDG